MFSKEQLISFFEKRAGVSKAMRKLTPARSPAQKSSLAKQPTQTQAPQQSAPTLPPSAPPQPTNIDFNQVAKPQTFDPSSVSNLPDPMRIA